MIGLCQASGSNGKRAFGFGTASIGRDSRISCSILNNMVSVYFTHPGCLFHMFCCDTQQGLQAQGVAPTVEIPEKQQQRDECNHASRMLWPDTFVSGFHQNKESAQLRMVFEIVNVIPREGTFL